MDTVWDKIIKGIAVAGGAIAGLYGGWSALLTVLVSVMAIDYLTGLATGIAHKSTKTESGGLSSKAGFVGLIKKGMIMAVVLLATMIDKAIGSEGMVFQSAAACFYIANEGISILENAVLLGLPVPDIMRSALDSLKKKGDATEKKTPGE